VSAVVLITPLPPGGRHARAASTGGPTEAVPSVPASSTDPDAARWPPPSSVDLGAVRGPPGRCA